MNITSQFIHLIIDKLQLDKLMNIKFIGSVVLLIQNVHMKTESFDGTDYKIPPYVNDSKFSISYTLKEIFNSENDIYNIDNIILEDSSFDYYFTKNDLVLIEVNGSDKDLVLQIKNTKNNNTIVNNNLKVQEDNNYDLSDKITKNGSKYEIKFDPDLIVTNTKYNNLPERVPEENIDYNLYVNNVALSDNSGLAIFNKKPGQFYYFDYSNPLVGVDVGMSRYEKLDVSNDKRTYSSTYYSYNNSQLSSIYGWSMIHSTDTNGHVTLDLRDNTNNIYGIILGHYYSSRYISHFTIDVKRPSDSSWTTIQSSISGLKLPENEREYSSIYNDDPVGTGHAQSTINSNQAWSAKTNDVNQWIKFDLSESKVRGIAIQGRKNNNPMDKNI